jgi:hypothetical protein
MDMAFPVEEIPNDAILFRKIHLNHYDEQNGRVISAAFRDDRMSVNWEKYRSAADTADSDSVFVVSLLTQKCRELKQSVEHTPIEPHQESGPNQAHVDVCGNKSRAVSQKLRDSIVGFPWIRSDITRQPLQ